MPAFEELKVNAPLEGKYSFHYLEPAIHENAPLDENGYHVSNIDTADISNLTTEGDNSHFYVNDQVPQSHHHNNSDLVRCCCCNKWICFRCGDVTLIESRPLLDNEQMNNDEDYDISNCVMWYYHNTCQPYVDEWIIEHPNLYTKYVNNTWGISEMRLQHPLRV